MTPTSAATVPAVPTRSQGAPASATKSSAASSRVAALIAAARKLIPLALWGLAPALLTVLALVTVLAGRSHVHGAGDFRYAFWPAGDHVLHGVSPYAAPGSALITRSIAFVYPAVAAVLFAPLALIPVGLGGLVFMALNIAAGLGTLRVLGVRDWRLYGLALLTPAVLSGWLLGNVTLLLGLGLAVAWRYRERPLVSGALIALLISVKLFLWPLGLWLLATRRFMSVAYAVVFGLLLNALAWAILGFGELGRYARLLHALTAAEQRRGYSVISIALRAGAGEVVAYAVAAVLVAAGLVAMAALSRRGAEVAALALAIWVSLLATPIVQLHYFALALVPLALVRPRLSLAWGLPVAMWLCTGSAPWQGAVGLLLGGAVLATAALPPARHWRTAPAA
jgi:hypothetical protein